MRQTQGQSSDIRILHETLYPKHNKTLGTGGGKGEGGPDPDEMMVMIQRCEQDGRRAERSSLGYDITTGDLIVPGRVYHLQDDVTFGTTTGSGGGGGVGEQTDAASRNVQL